MTRPEINLSQAGLFLREKLDARDANADSKE
jgi:hypothetical protein